jgi:hypothetical protein
MKKPAEEIVNLNLFFYPEDGGSMFHVKVKHSQKYTALQIRKP